MPDKASPAPPLIPRLDTHIPALDGLRGVAILGVIIFHQACLKPSSAFDREFLRLAGLLQSGVDLFFVLSGFLITGILEDSKGSRNFYRNFYARRILRIFPLYYLILFFGLLVLPLVGHPKSDKWGHIAALEQLWYWAFLSNWWIALRGYGPRNGLIDLSWTLSIEEQFYLVWPILVGSFGRRHLIRICIALVGIAIGFRTALVLSGSPAMWAHMMTPARLDALAIGALIALLARAPRGIGGLVRPARFATISGFSTLAALFLSMRVFNAGHGLFVVLGGTATPIFFGGLLVIAISAPPGSFASRSFGNRFLRTFGVYSFALYLFHNPIQAAIRDIAYGPDEFCHLFGSSLPGQLLFCLMGTIPALGCAWLSWHLFEAPILRLKRYFPSGRSAIDTGQSAPRFDARAGRSDSPPPIEKMALDVEAGIR